MEHDLLLVYSSQDQKWADKIIKSLRNEGLEILATSSGKGKKQPFSKVIVLWSESFFAEEKLWKSTEKWTSETYQKERVLVPVLLEDCSIPPIFAPIPHLNFRIEEDYPLNLYHLLQALDFFRTRFSEKEKQEPADFAERGKESYEKGKVFEEEVALLYEMLGFQVKKDLILAGEQIDLLIEQKLGISIQAVVTCKNTQIRVEEQEQILGQQNIVQKKHPAWRWIAASSQGYAANARTALEEAGVLCTTYTELLKELFPLEDYVKRIIEEQQKWTAENWEGKDCYIRPRIANDITYEEQDVLSRMSEWLQGSKGNFLVVLGDLGTGKSTLCRFLAYRLALQFHKDPLRHPAPVLIPLSEVRKEVSLEGVIIQHFTRRGFKDFQYSRFEHLLQLGKIVLFFDGFDEMADRVRWDTTQQNFRELRRAAQKKGKVMLTCRTHYFKNKTEESQIINKSFNLSEKETELYKTLRQRSNGDVVYLREFEDKQIQSYLQKKRPETTEEDWRKIQNIYSLKDLATRPLLLEMIVKTLTRFKKDQEINLANLYQVYTSEWVERELEEKPRFLQDRKIRLQLMQELAWRMWDEEKQEVHYRELIPFVESLAKHNVMEIRDEDIEIIAGEMQTASFLKRDEKGNFFFMHPSFMEYFLAQTIFRNILRQEENQSLRTRQLDQKTIYFLLLLDSEEQLAPLLKKILEVPYEYQISENALLVFFEKARFRKERGKLPFSLKEWVKEQENWLSPGYLSLLEKMVDSPEEAHSFNTKAHQKALQLSKELKTQEKILQELGTLALGQKEWEQALSCFGQATKMNPEKGEYYREMGVALFHQEKSQPALEMLDKAIALNRGDSPSWREKGKVLFFLKREKEAIQHYQKSLELEPGDLTTKGHLGIAYRMRSQKQEARNLLKEAISHNGPEQNLFLFYYIDTLLQLGDLSEAKKMAEKASQSFPQDEKMDLIRTMIHSHEQNRKEYQDKMAQSQEFSQQLRHKIGNSLFLFRGIVKNIELEGLSSFNEDRFQSLKEGVDKIQALIKELKVLETPFSGQKKKTDLKKEMENFKKEIPSHSARIEIHCVESFPECEVNPPYFQQAMGEILENSVKNGKQSNIRIDLSFNPLPVEYNGEQKKFIRLKIQDDGPGIPLENKQKIFDPFFSRNNGTGLGLAIVKRIVEEEHKGYITETGAPGKGACFEIYLPYFSKEKK